MSINSTMSGKRAVGLYELVGKLYATLSIHELFRLQLAVLCTLTQKAVHRSLFMKICEIVFLLSARFISIHNIILHIETTMYT